MNIKILAVFVSLSIAMIISSQSAHAVPIETGVFTQNSLRTCGSPDRCFMGDTLIDFVSDFDVGVSGTATTQQIDPNDSTAQGASSAGFQGPGFTPAISSYADAGVQTRFTVGNLAIQRYTFLSDGDLDLGGTLTYSQSGSTSPDAMNPRGEISAGFVSFQMDGGILETDNCNLLSAIGQQNAAGLLGSCILRNGETTGLGTIEFLGLSNVQSVAFDTGRDPILNGNATANLIVNGTAGDVFFLGAFMTTFSHLGGFSDSRNTLLLDLGNPSLVQASFAQDSFVKAPVRVPEPGTLTLFGVGLLVFGLARGKAA